MVQCNMRLWSVAFWALGLAAAGCGLYDPTPPTTIDAEEQTVSTAQEQLPLTIGDVESKVSMVADVAASSKADNIQVDTLRSRNERVQLRTIHVAPPFPEQLICEFHLVSEQNFPDNPVAIVGRVLRDDEKIGDFDAVLGAEAVRRIVENPEALPSLHYYFDVLEGLDEIPETMLVVAEMDAKLTPTGTDEDTLDPQTVEVHSADRGVLRSNPLRINFLLEDVAEEVAEEVVEEVVEDVAEEVQLEDQPSEQEQAEE